MKRLGGLSSSQKSTRVINYGKPSASPSQSQSTSSTQPETSSASSPNAGKLLKPAVPSPREPTIKPSAKPSLHPKPQTQPVESTSGDAESYWTVMWCKASGKKHKTYNDGFLSLSGIMATLYDADGKIIGKTRLASAVATTLSPSTMLDVSRNDVEIMAPLSKEEFQSGKIFSSSTSDMTKDAVEAPGALKYAPKGTLPSGSLKSSKTLSKDSRRIARYDPDAPGACVLFRPPAGSDEVAVVLEPRIASRMRPHQLEGVKFMYECINGLRNIPENGRGCILADEMGLGKTLQGIALIRTVLTQGPISREPNPKVIVVAPTSLVSNWVKEVKKWLGPERLQPVWIGDGATKENKKKLEDFVSAPVQQMLVLSYENVRQNVQILKKCRFRLMICDEGHRLKNNDAKISISLMELECPRRILLTGTPFQNNLGEFYALANFVNPGILGSQSQFKQIYDGPISKLHDPRCNPAQRSLGAERAAELARLTKVFILRRTSDVLENFLPPKVEHVIFCRPTETQTSLANHFLESEFVHRALTGQASSLACIQHLSKIFNHPELLLGSPSGKTLNSQGAATANDDDVEADSGEEMSDVEEDVEEIKRLFPAEYEFGSFDAAVASKLAVLESILDKLGPKDKMVIVSNFTKTLDVIERLCVVKKKLATLRLDGQTDNAVRQQRVDTFQSDLKQRIFLLSTKAGGVGLNLFAANRLVLFDSGWNPAHDAQAQARVWRDGQTQKTFIYRLLNTGTMEEKIFQRQISKLGMSKTVVDTDSRSFFGRTSSTHFSPEELRDIFTINLGTICDTHDLSGCSCNFASSDEGQSKRRKLNSGSARSTISVQEIADWKHCGDTSSSPDLTLASISSPSVTFMMFRETIPSMATAASKDGVAEDESDALSDQDEMSE